MNKYFVLILSAFALSSCAYTKAGVPRGMFYTNWKDRSEITTQFDNSIKPLKTGRACVKNILYVTSFGNASIEEAKKKAGITKISNVSDSLFTVGVYIPFYYKGCTIVTGE